MKYARMAVLLVCVVMTRSVTASGGMDLLSSKDATGLVQAIGIVVNNNVSDGCWVDSSDVSEKAKALLETAGINVVLGEVEAFDASVINMTVSGTGHNVKGSCVGSVEIFTYYHLSTLKPPIAVIDRVVNYSRGSVILESEGTLDTAILEYVESSVEQYVNEFQKALKLDAVRMYRNTFGISDVVVR